MTTAKMDSNVWWLAHCENCGWQNSSELLEGGGPMADTGDYSDPLCPHCMGHDIYDAAGPEQAYNGIVDIKTQEGNPDKKHVEPDWSEIYKTQFPNS